MKTIELSDFQVEMLKSITDKLTFGMTDPELDREVQDLREKLIGTRRVRQSLRCRLGRCKMRGK